jgi:U3 small nucleolar RNA-associated protein 22
VSKSSKLAAPPEDHDSDVASSSGSGAVQDMGIYDDPMIDPPYSGSDEDDDEEAGIPEEDVVVEDENANIPSAFPEEPVRTLDKGKGKSLYAPPTLQELDRLNPQTSTSTFNLQLNALLNSTIIPSTSTSHNPLRSILKSLHSHIMSLPSIPAIPPKKAIAKIRKMGGEMPFVVPQEYGIKGDEKWGLGWSAPEEVFVGGSWSVVGGYRKGKGEMGGVDMVVVMPKVSGARV